MAISASLVKELRDRTGAGMMECKKALVEAGGDIEAAAELMRKSGVAKADKRAGRIAAEGVIAIDLGEDGRVAAMVELNSETDFVAKGKDFQDLAQLVVSRVRTAAPADVDAALGLPSGGGAGTIDEARRALIAKLGENVALRRFVRMESEGGLLGSYMHGRRIGVLVDLSAGGPELAKDLAMHIAASRPMCISPAEVPPEVIAKEREIAEAQAAASGKPAHIAEKIAQGRVSKFLDEVSLLGQAFVKDTSLSVGELLKTHGAQVLRFARFEVGEGVEKKTENFADEVMSQVRGG